MYLNKTVLTLEVVLSVHEFGIKILVTPGKYVKRETLIATLNHNSNLNSHSNIFILYYCESVYVGPCLVSPARLAIMLILYSVIGLL